MKLGGGRFVTVVGPSGCGKTTLLRMAAGLIVADSGEVRLDGAVLTTPSPKMSMVFQAIGLMPWKTIDGNVALGVQLRVHRRTLDAAEMERVDATIALVGLKGFEHYIRTSCRAACSNASAWSARWCASRKSCSWTSLSVHSDAQTRAVLQDELLSLWGRVNSTVLFITHDLDGAIYLSETVVIMGRRPGRIKQVLEVKLPQPRYSYDARAEAEFTRLRSIAWQSIKEEL